MPHRARECAACRPAAIRAGPRVRALVRPRRATRTPPFRRSSAGPRADRARLGSLSAESIPSEFLTVSSRPMRFVLASKSPRRREVLAAAGLDFDVAGADVPEVRAVGESPADYVQRLAREKAEAIAADRPDRIVVGA